MGFYPYLCLFITVGRYCMTETKHLKNKIICIFKQETPMLAYKNVCHLCVRVTYHSGMSNSIWPISGTGLRLEKRCLIMWQSIFMGGQNGHLFRVYLFNCNHPLLMYMVYNKAGVAHNKVNVHTGRKMGDDQDHFYN